MLDYIFLAISVFGFTYLLRYLDGPFDILRKFRELSGIRYVPEYELLNQSVYLRVRDNVEEIPDKLFAKLVGCFWCLSTWISILYCVTYAILYSKGIFETFTGIFICVGISGTI